MNTEILDDYYLDTDGSIPEYRAWLYSRRGSLVNLIDFYQDLIKKTRKTIKKVDLELKRIGEK